MRKQTGWGLKEAKEFMDNYMPMSPNFDYDISAEKFVRENSIIRHAEFVSSDEMKIT